MRLMRVQIRETNRLSMHRILGTEHTNSDWPVEVRKMVAKYVMRIGAVAFLKSLGYKYRGPKRLRHPDPDELPDIVLSSTFEFFRDVPPEVVNTAWLMLTLKKRNAVQKAQLTKRAKRLRMEVEAQRQLKRAREEVDSPHGDEKESSVRAGADSTQSDTDEWSAGGF